MTRHALDLGHVVGDVSRWSRAIVARRVGIIAGLPAVLTLLTALGIHVSDGRVQSIVVAVLDVLALVAGIGYAQAGTTPADPALGPVSANGVRLVEYRGPLE